MSRESFTTRPIENWPEDHKMIATQTVEGIIELSEIISVLGASKGDLLTLTFVADSIESHEEIVRAFAVAHDGSGGQGVKFLPSTSDAVLAAIDIQMSYSVLLFHREEYQKSLKVEEV